MVSAPKQRICFKKHVTIPLLTCFALFMKAISMDLRQRIVDAYDQGDTTRQKVAKRFGVFSAFV